MSEIPVQRVLIAFLRRCAPLEYAAASAELRRRYAANMAATTPDERRLIAREYRQAKAALVIRLARALSFQ